MPEAIPIQQSFANNARKKLFLFPGQTGDENEFFSCEDRRDRVMTR
jgi:hypothetical protein